MTIEPTYKKLNILIIGAGGGVGRHCVEVALAQEHYVTAVLRNPAKLQLNHANLKIVRGDINDPLSFAEYLINADVAISAIGHGGGLFDDKPTNLYSRGALNLLREAEKAQVPRAIFISASGLDVSPKNPFYVRFFLKNILQKLLKHSYADLHLMESIIKMSPVNWTIIRPPQLTNGPLTGNYRFAINDFLDNCLKVSRADVAHFIITHIDHEDIYKSTIEVSN